MLPAVRFASMSGGGEDDEKAPRDGVSLALSSLGLPSASAQAGAAQSQSGKHMPTAKPVSALAMDGPRVGRHLITHAPVNTWANNDPDW